MRVVHPAIELTKTALVPVVLDPDADTGQRSRRPDARQAEYLYDVANTGTVPIADVVLEDDRCAPVTFVGRGHQRRRQPRRRRGVALHLRHRPRATAGDTAPPVDESGLVTNTATVSGTPFLPDDPSQTGPEVTDSDTAQVLVIEPSLTLTKSASADAVVADSDVTYTIVVTNTGDVGLDVIGPVDAKCAPLDFTGGDANNNGLLDGANSGAAGELDLHVHPGGRVAAGARTRPMSTRPA